MKLRYLLVVFGLVYIAALTIALFGLGFTSHVIAATDVACGVWLAWYGFGRHTRRHPHERTRAFKYALVSTLVLVPVLLVHLKGLTASSEMESVLYAFTPSVLILLVGVVYANNHNYKKEQGR